MFQKICAVSLLPPHESVGLHIEFRSWRCNYSCNEISGIRPTLAGRLRGLHGYLIDGCVNVLGAVRITGWSTCGRPDLLVQGAGARRAAQPGAVLVGREYARRRWYPACCGLSTRSVQPASYVYSQLRIRGNAVIMPCSGAYLCHVWWKAFQEPTGRRRCPLDRSGPMRPCWGPTWDQAAAATSDRFVVASLTLNLRKPNNTVRRFASGTTVRIEQFGIGRCGNSDATEVHRYLRLFLWYSLIYIVQKGRIILIMFSYIV